MYQVISTECILHWTACDSYSPPVFQTSQVSIMSKSFLSEVYNAGRPVIRIHRGGQGPTFVKVLCISKSGHRSCALSLRTTIGRRLSDLAAFVLERNRLFIPTIHWSWHPLRFFLAPRQLSKWGKSLENSLVAQETKPNP